MPWPLVSDCKHGAIGSLGRLWFLGRSNCFEKLRVYPLAHRRCFEDGQVNNISNVIFFTAGPELASLYTADWRDLLATAQGHPGKTELL